MIKYWNERLLSKRIERKRKKKALDFPENEIKRKDGDDLHSAALTLSNRAINIDELMALDGVNDGKKHFISGSAYLG
jgi:hypothetical protein